MKPRFLVDENLTPAIGESVRRHDASRDILHVGDRGAPPFRTEDPIILDFCERERRILVTKNRKSMPQHVEEHLRAGGQVRGILSVKKGCENDIGRLVETLTLVWECEVAEDYLDKHDGIPF